ncbi:MAG: alpha/beta fold hydrolase [Arcticibacter sp.]
MKRFVLLTLLLALLLTNGYAQDTPATRSAAQKFVGYFNAGKSDSLYTLFSDEVKKSISPASLPVLISQLKGQLGALLTSEFFSADKGITSFICPFEKSGPVLYLHFNSNNQLAGFYVNADRRQQTALKAEEQLITVNTPGAVLKGTLSVPPTTGKMPVVILIAGSGPTDRNGNSMLINGKPDYFLKLSDELRANNIAVLRYDKRGVGQSSNSTPEAKLSFDDGVNDAVALIKYLKNDKRFSKVLVAGHSEGSLVGIVAAEREKVDGLISLSGAGYSAYDLLKTQFKTSLSPDDNKRALTILDTIRSGNQVHQPLTAGFDALFRPSVHLYLSSWMKFDPQTEIAKLQIPVLIVQGTHDIQVDADNAKRLKNAQPKAKLLLVEGMSHILKAAPADRQLNAATYSQNELPLHPQLVGELTKFIRGI